MAGAIQRIDPRVRIIVAAAWSILVVMLATPGVTAFALAASVPAVAMSGLHRRTVLHRLATLNVFMALLWLTLPISMEGPARLHILGLSLSQAGLRDALLISLKGNAIVLALTGLIASIDTATLGNALRALRVPTKLALILVLTVRYVPVLRRELERLHRAMRVRCFHPRFDIHTGRTFGYLVGMLLVRACVRAERILAAMRCRGFTGDFPRADFARVQRSDALFACASFGIATVLLGVDRLWPAL